MNKLSSGVTLVFWKQADMDAAVQSLLTPPGEPTPEHVGDWWRHRRLRPRSHDHHVRRALHSREAPRRTASPTRPSGRRSPGTPPFPVEAPSYVPKPTVMSHAATNYAHMYDIDCGVTEQSSRR